ncbi:DUF58 domain-containing protein [Halosegnis marinus]|uniref:DUF58 domain-containing protein n=1 Tax=Halosegnis marinus TaxID=3034023 RepID=A0ABD5ZM03_9EURY|nr:DUF58 domain-containing protein [Halosegnis sp. DT85]
MTRRVALASVLLFAGVGVLFASPTALVAAVVPLAYVVADAASAVPASPAIAVERSLSPASPTPGDRVTVTLSLSNEGESALADVRVVDGVPDALAVVEGSPRAAVALPVDGSAEVSYEVVAKRGDFAFGDPTVRLRPTVGDDPATATLPVAGATALESRGTAAPPRPEAARLQAGTLTTDRSGQGIEFRSVREYRHGDALSRLDWRRLAKTGELATVEYREEHALRLLVLVDARPETRTVPEPGYPTGGEAAAYAGRVLYDALRSGGHVAGAAAVGLPNGYLPEGHAGDGLAWVDDRDPRDPTAVFERAEAAGAATDTTAQRAIRDDAAVGRVLGRLRPNTHVVFVTPLADDWPTTLARRLTVAGHPLTVVSPDGTGDSTPGGEVAALERRLRLRAVRLLGADTVDWDRDRPLRASLETSVREVLSR